MLGDWRMSTEQERAEPGMRRHAAQVVRLSPQGVAAQMRARTIVRIEQTRL